MNRIFNENDIVKSHWDNKNYIITQVWGEILICKNGKNLIRLMDFEVDLVIKHK